MTMYRSLTLHHVLVLTITTLCSANYASFSLAEDHPKIDLHHGWKSLFNGKDLTGWRRIKPMDRWTLENEKDADGTWVVENGTLARKGGADLWTVEKYGDFILDLEHKFAPGCNSGVLFRLAPPSDKTKGWWEEGALEMQILDTCGVRKPTMHDGGSLYDMMPPAVNAMRKAGKWNHATITAKGSKIKFVLNGKKVIDTDLNRWAEAHKNPDGTPNKFSNPFKHAPRRGYIFLQDHGAPVWFRNIYIKKLDGAARKAGKKQNAGSHAAAGVTE
jgi:hypothetical protein